MDFVYHSTLGLRVIKRKDCVPRGGAGRRAARDDFAHPPFRRAGHAGPGYPTHLPRDWYKLKNSTFKIPVFLASSGRGADAHRRTVGSAGRRGRWGIPTLAMHIRIQPEIYSYMMITGGRRRTISHTSLSVSMSDIIFPMYGSPALHTEERESLLNL